VGLRVPSLRKRVGARLSLRRRFVDRLGLRMPRGWVRNRHKALYNKLYARTTFSIGGLAGWLVALVLVVLSDALRTSR